MKKKTIKTCLNVIIGFLSLIFHSCQHDEFIEQSKNNDFIFKTITVNEVKSHSDKAATLFTKSTKSSKFNKTSSATEIDSSNVIYLERKNGFKSFTYRLKDDVSLNQFNNIVVYEFPDGSNKVFTVKYLLNKSLLEATKENNLKSSIIGYETSVLKFNNPYQKAASYSCISIGYWVVVDKCEGELVTPENNPRCFNSDGSRATREVFITMEENCSYSGGGSNSGEIYVGGSPTDFLDNGGGGAGLTSYDGIFIPNPYVLGEEDPRNADFNYSMQVSQYLNTITSWKSLLYQANTYGGMSTYWMQPFFVDYFKKNGGLTTENKNIVKSVIDRFNEIYTNENAYKVYENSTERNLINYKLFQTLTNYPTISAKTIQDIFIFRAQNFWSSESLEFTDELLTLCTEENNTQDANSLVNISILINYNSNIIFEDDFITSLDPYVDLDLTTVPPDFGNLFGIKLYLNYRKIRILNPEWSKGKCIWYASRDLIHLSLDAFGLIPVGGEIADLANGVLYTIEGDGVNATFSFASAVPVAGWAATGVKYSLKVVNTAVDINTKVKLVWKVLPNGNIYFGAASTCRAKLRKILGLAVGNPLIAHHIMPVSVQAEVAIQKAAKSSSAFHLNEAFNGLALNSLQHSGSHTTYTNLITAKLRAFDDLNPNATPMQCYNYVTSLINQIKAWVISHPNTNINLITLP